MPIEALGQGGRLVLLALLCACSAPLTAQEKKSQASQGFTGYPSSVYMRPLLACASDAPCTQTDKFHLDQVPTGCCVLIVTNGDGLLAFLLLLGPFGATRANVNPDKYEDELPESHIR